MAWQCFRCDKNYSNKVKFCPDCGTPQVVDADPELQDDKSWLIIVGLTIVLGFAIPAGLYFFS